MVGVSTQLRVRYYCKTCGCDVAFRSHPRTFTERFLLPIFLHQPVRCSECFCRDYRSIFTAVNGSPAITNEKPRNRAA